MMEPLEVLYQDEKLIAINKPSGLLVHRSMIDRHETRFAMQILRDQVGKHVYPVHRLDKPTSGVLLFAFDSEAARLMTTLFTEGEVSKTYIAVVRGYTIEQDTIDYPLKEELDKIADKKADANKPAQSAVTEYRRLATVELPHPVGRYQTARYSLIEVKPQTGRKHQIRRHMKHIFHPIVGDTSYGDGKHNEFFRREFNCFRLMLTASKLEFIHPYTRVPLSLESKADEDFKRISALFEEMNS